MSNNYHGILFLYFENVIFKSTDIINKFHLRIKSVEVPDFVEIKPNERMALDFKTVDNKTSIDF